MTEAVELARLVAEFGQAYTRRIWEEMERAGTTPARARLLMALQCQGCGKMSDLSDRLGVTPRNVTKLVDGLEEEGLVARGSPARPTGDRGAANGAGGAGEQGSALASDAAAGLFARLDEADREHLARILRRLVELLAGGK